jgi:hypothetical protein
MLSVGVCIAQLVAPADASEKNDGHEKANRTTA